MERACRAIAGSSRARVLPRKVCISPLRCMSKYPPWRARESPRRNILLAIMACCQHHADVHDALQEFFGMRSRRAILAEGGSALALASTSSWAAPQAPDFPFPGGIGARPLTKDFPQKGAMVLQRSRPPMLETPFAD